MIVGERVAMTALKKGSFNTIARSCNSPVALVAKTYITSIEAFEDRGCRHFVSRLKGCRTRKKSIHA